ncbi:hypothetical protein DCC62_02335 [candidate division KSB1 bacterium]|nr:MAG: hypothetical protein DCC62_02335 [candidate division KSB1 bacterium]
MFLNKRLSFSMRFADGIAILRAAELVADILENATLSTAAEDYAWQIRDIGAVDFTSGKIHIDPTCSEYKVNNKRIKSFSLLAYVEQALKLAEYEKDENGIIVAHVPNVSGFFSQGDNFEEARDNLRDAIEGNLVVALQLGFEIPQSRF